MGSPEDDTEFTVFTSTDDKGAVHAVCRFRVLNVPVVVDQYHAALADPDELMTFVSDVHNWWRTYGNIMDEVLLSACAELQRQDQLF